MKYGVNFSSETKRGVLCGAKMALLKHICLGFSDLSQMKIFGPK